MSPTASPEAPLPAENAELRARLEAAEETLRAIRSGEVDAFIVDTEQGPQLFTLQGLDAESNRFLGEILVLVSDAVIATNGEERVTYINAAAERQYGLVAATTLGCKLAELYGIRWLRSEDEAEAMTALSERGEWRGENIHVTREGRELHVESRVTMSLADDGRSKGLVAVIRDITERKQSEEGLRQSEERYRRVIETAHEGIWMIDAEGRTTYVNQRIADLLGYSSAEMAGRGHTDFMWEEDHPTGDLELSLRRQGIAQVWDQRYRRKDGRELWTVASCNGMFDPEGTFIGALGMFTDITDRKRVEATLVAREREFRSLADNTPDILTRIDRDLRHVFVNAAIKRATGRSPDEFLGKTNRELGMPSDVCDLWEAAIRDVFKHGLQKLVDFTLDSPDGPRHYASQLVPEVGPDGAVEFVLGVARDVTDARAAEEAVQASAERLTRAQRAAEMGTWDWDLVSGELAWTAEAWLLLGRSAEADGPPTYDLWLSCLHPDDRERAAAAVAAAITAGPYRDEYRVRHHDGREVWLEAVGEVVRDTTGAAVRMLGTIRDITDRKKSDETLRAADQRKDEFLATLAHELRNPLAPIRNGLNVLGTAHLPDDMENVVAMMDRQLGHLVNLVDDLLDVSRVRTGKITLRAERVTVMEALDAAVEACRPTIDEKFHTLEVVHSPEPLSVSGDKTRLVQAIANLLTNAAKYSEPRASIRLTAKRENGEVVIQVSDTGTGIAPDLLPTLWDLFTQVRDTLDKAQGGLGIGLSLVKNLVEMHGGTVAAASDGVGQGSTFTIRLPLTETVDPIVTSFPDQNGSATNDQVGRRVLLVDDNMDAAESLAMLLQLSGHETATAHSGLAALEVAQTFRPDIVFLDIGLPAGMDGYEVARRLRADPHTANAVLVALTGWGSDDDKRKSTEAGFDFHLTKPAGADAVQAVFDRFAASRVALGDRQRVAVTEGS